ncbi:MAG: hypothetical protein UU83_C0014G0011 [Candidatus Jorgensenbacteria bacterium GW2011_GWF2_41_8]|uniref:Polysaccharide biosynthesis protein n=1 Tax=Candidatus Jorgensenbacteria bacterium GW2011_GWF2_41_8 TaxID=1618667 RepID=A0A0G1AI31_9BACT|nr:MAG: hypothetical protein UU83_C0014G0011 [Candidatus Jorgensenbacteria bacterium GW2011_GWF2_41_8]
MNQLLKLEITIKNLASHRFIHNVATLQVGSFLGNFIQAGIGIFLARMLQPERFGEYALAIGMASLASIVLGSGIQDAAANLLGSSYARKDAEETKNVLAFTIKITFFAALLTILILPFLPFISRALYKDFWIGIYAAVIVIASIFSVSFFSLSTMALQAVGKIRGMMMLAVSDQIARYGLALVFTAVGFGVLGAVSGHLIGAVILFLQFCLLFGHLSNTRGQ